MKIVLAALHTHAARADLAATRRIDERELELGRRLTAPERYELYGDAPLAVSPVAGELFYLLAAAGVEATVVEFGAAHGISTIYLAAGLRDGGSGRLISTEIVPAKARRAEQNLARAGLSDLVELRVGDALRTLAQLDEAVDLLVLDGRNDQYLAVLELVAPRLTAHALVLADLSPGDPDIDTYQARMRRPDSGYHSIELPVGHGAELSVKLAGGG